MQVEQPVQEAEVEQQVLTPVRERGSGHLGLVQPLADVVDVVSEGGHALARGPLAHQVGDQQTGQSLAFDRGETDGRPRPFAECVVLALPGPVEHPPAPRHPQQIVATGAPGGGAAARVRGCDPPRRSRAGTARARHRLWHRRFPSCRRRPGGRGLRPRRLRRASRDQPDACSRGRPPRRRDAGPSLRGRLLRRRRRVQLVLLRGRHGRGAARGEAGREAPGAGRDPGLGTAGKA